MSGYTRIETLGFVAGAAGLVVAIHLFGDVAYNLLAPTKPLTRAVLSVSAPGHTAPEAAKPAAPAPAATADAKPDASAPEPAAEATADGQAAAKACAACHTFDKGGKDRVGPNLYGVVGRPKGSVEGFKYSDALASAGGNWTPEDLAKFVAAPKEVIPGTKMAFAGIKDEAQRTALIGYLSSLSDDAAPAAAAEAPTPAEPTAPQEAPPAKSDAVAGDAAKGEAAAKICAACHSFDEGGKAKVGPNLYGIVGRAKGGVEGFKYSKALAAAGGSWSTEDLDQFLASPKDFAAGTKMTFAGIKDAATRADVVAYLASLGGTAPAAQAAAAPADAAPEPPPEPQPEPVAAAPEPEAPKVSAEEHDLDSLIKVCAECHSLQKGAKHKTGPNLSGVLNAPMAKAEGYDYSVIFSALSGVWSADELDRYLTSPADFMPGTKSTFEGLPNPADRAKVIEYLGTLGG